MNLGACKYCGAVIMGDYPEDASNERKIEIATSNCKCEAAENERFKLREKERAKVMIKDLFILKSEELGYTAPIEDKDIHRILEEIVDLISEKTIRGVTIDIGNGEKAKIQLSSQNKINVERSQNIKYKLEA